MKPIIALAAIAVVGVTLGTGFLNNDIELWIQQFGVGSGDIQTPVDHVKVDFNIATQEVDPPTDPITFENVIDECILTPDELIGVGPGGTDNDETTTDDNPTKLSSMTCKLTGKDPQTWEPNGQIITEGKVCAQQFPAMAPVIIPMGFTCDETTGQITPIANAPTAVGVKLVGDVIVVAHSNEYSMGDPVTQP